MARTCGEANALQGDIDWQEIRHLAGSIHLPTACWPSPKQLSFDKKL